MGRPVYSLNLQYSYQIPKDEDKPEEKEKRENAIIENVMIN
jgi:hypothetical protein